MAEIAGLVFIALLFIAVVAAGHGSDRLHRKLREERPRPRDDAE